MPKIKNKKDSYDVEVGPFQIFFMKKYRLLRLLNELFLGLWFFIGSFLFLWESTMTVGIIFFILGSTQMLGRPLLKMMHAFYIRKGSPDNKK